MGVMRMAHGRGGRSTLNGAAVKVPDADAAGVRLSSFMTSSSETWPASGTGTWVKFFKCVFKRMSPMFPRALVHCYVDRRSNVAFWTRPNCTIDPYKPRRSQPHLRLRPQKRDFLVERRTSSTGSAPRSRPPLLHCKCTGRSHVYQRSKSWTRTRRVRGSPPASSAGCEKHCIHLIHRKES